MFGVRAGAVSLAFPLGAPSLHEDGGVAPSPHYEIYCLEKN